jgi:hypothetical protein
MMLYAALIISDYLKSDQETRRFSTSQSDRVKDGSNVQRASSDQVSNRRLVKRVLWHRCPAEDLPWGNDA